MQFHHSQYTPERDRLSDIDWDGRAIGNTSQLFGGVELLPKERAFVLEQVGKDGVFLRDVQSIMRSPDGKAFMERMKKVRSQGLNSKQYAIDDAWYIHNKLDAAMMRAIKVAEGKMQSELPSSYQRLKEQEFTNKQNKYNTQKGNTDLILPNY